MCGPLCRGISGTLCADSPVYKGTVSSQTVTGLINGTTYYFKYYTRKGSNWSTGIETSATPDYCIPTYTSQCSSGYYIEDFSFNTLSNQNSNCNGNTNSYIKYPSSSFTTTIKETETYALSVKISSLGTGHINVWIDYDDDGTFEDTEKIYATTSRISSPYTINTNITIPSNVSGTHRMRVREAYLGGSNTNSITVCGNHDGGETEDYTITIIPYDLPRLSTTDASGINQTTATVGGVITELNGAALTERGVVYNTTAGVTIANGTKVIDSSLGLGQYSSQITGLQDNKTYYFKAYAANANNITTYGTEKSFTTSSVAAPLAISASNPTATSFTANWNVAEGASSYKLDVSLLNAFGTTQTLLSDGFENTTTFTTSGGAYYSGNSSPSDGPASSPFSSGGTYARGISSSSGSATLTSSNINTSSLTSASLTFRLASFSIGSTSNGADAGDIVTVEISPNGTTYYSTIRVLGATANNAYWDYTATGIASTAYDGNSSPVDFQPAGSGLRTTDGYSTVTVTGLPITSNLKIRITLLNNSTSERWLIDDFSLTGFTNSYIAGYDNLNVNGTSQDITGLSANTTYYYRVRANGTNSNSGNSNVVSTAITDGAANWSSLANTASTTDITVTNNSTLTLDAAANCRSITVMNGGKLTRNSSTTLTLNGGTLSIKNGGSFLDNGSGNLAATMEREISAANWNSTDEGWHVLSSPVVGQGISGAFTPTGTYNDYDFYAWDEENYTWLNQKVSANNINSFGNAIGYLVAYQQAGTKTFEGNLNNADVTATLSFANTTANKKGWNLLGNPYPCALDWSNAAWDKSKIDGAKIWNSTSKNWVDLPLATTANIIPANQGFLVKANAGESFTIPAAARVHSGQGFYKSTSDMLILKAEKTGTTFNDVMGIDFNSSATLAFDAQKDAIEFETFGDAPSLYSVLSTSENVSINAVPAQLAASTVINLNFKARTNGQYSINATTIPSIPACAILLLEDSKTNVTHNLKLNPVYNFTATATDNINRFKLHFQTFTGIEENENNSTLVYAENGKVIISSNLKIKLVEVYNAIGQLVYQSNGKSNQLSVNASGFTRGTYIVRLITDQKIHTQKLVINN